MLHRLTEANFEIPHSKKIITLKHRGENHPPSKAMVNYILFYLQDFVIALIAIGLELVRETLDLFQA